MLSPQAGLVTASVFELTATNFFLILKLSPASGLSNLIGSRVALASLASPWAKLYLRLRRLVERAKTISSLQ